jgi:hypothetical protein
MAETKKTEEVVVTGRPLVKPEEQETETYVLREGMRHSVAGRMVGAGEEVELTKDQAIAFADKFQRASSEKQKKGAKLPAGVESTEPIRAGAKEITGPPPLPAPTSHTPQDIGAKTADLDAPKGNPGNVTGGVSTSLRTAFPTRPEALQSASEPAKGEAEAPKDAPVKAGVNPVRDSATAAIVGNAIQPPVPPDPKTEKK